MHHANPIMTYRKYSHLPQEFQFIRPKSFNFNKISHFSRYYQALRRNFLTLSWDTRYNDVLFRFLNTSCLNDRIFNRFGETFHFLDAAEWVAFYYNTKLVLNCNTPFWEECHFSLLSDADKTGEKWLNCDYWHKIFDFSLACHSL